MNRIDGESNKNVYRRFAMSSRGEGMSCGVVVVKCSTLRLCEHLERINECELTRIYKSKIDAADVRG